MNILSRGDRYVSASGAIWTIERLIERGGRIYLTQERGDGTCGIIIDIDALRRMVPLPALHPNDDEATDEGAQQPAQLDVGDASEHAAPLAAASAQMQHMA